MIYEGEGNWRLNEYYKNWVLICLLMTGNGNLRMSKKYGYFNMLKKFSQIANYLICSPPYFMNVAIQVWFYLS